MGFVGVASSSDAAAEIVRAVADWPRGAADLMPGAPPTESTDPSRSVSFPSKDSFRTFCTSRPRRRVWEGGTFALGVFSPASSASTSALDLDPSLRLGTRYDGAPNTSSSSAASIDVVSDSVTDEKRDVGLEREELASDESVAAASSTVEPGCEVDAELSSAASAGMEPSERV